MEVIHARCAGLDVQTDGGGVPSNAAGATGAAGGVRRFATTTRALLQLADWLRETGCTHVAMETTGVLEAGVAHAGRRVRAGPGQPGTYSQCAGAPERPQPRELDRGAASILTSAYYLLRDEVPYRELGSRYFGSYDQQRTLLRLTRRIQELGYHVEISKAA